MYLTSSEALISEIDWEMPVEVMRDFDTVVLFGKVAAANPEELTVRRASSEICFIIMEKESAVLVRCYDKQLAPILLRARVIRSSGTECVVGELELIPYKTQRKNVRYPLCPPAVISILDGAGEEQAQPCRLLNVSVGGACIVSGQDYAIGQTLYLQAGPADACGAYPCRVIRATPRRGGCFEYGLLFEKLNKRQLRCLEKSLWDWSHVRLDCLGGGLHE